MKKGIVHLAHLADELNIFSLNVPHNQYLHLGEEVQGHVIYRIPEGRRKGGGEKERIEGGRMRQERVGKRKEGRKENASVVELRTGVDLPPFVERRPQYSCLAASLFQASPPQLQHNMSPSFT